MGIELDIVRGFSERWKVSRFAGPGGGENVARIPVTAASLPMATANWALCSSAFWACCRLISASISTLPGHILEETRDGKYKALEHPLYRLLTLQPNPLMSYPQWIQTTVFHLMVYGNAFTLPVTLDGEVIALYPLDPERMTIEVQNGNRLDYKYAHRDGTKSSYRALDILHFRVFSLDGLIGLSPLEYQRLLLDSADASAFYAWSLWKSGGRPSGVLEYPGVLKEGQVKDIRAAWNSVHGGAGGSGQVAILAAGTKYTPVSVPLQQLEWIATQKLTVEQICRIFGVPPHLVGAADKPTYASVEQQSVEFRQFTIQPIVTSMERTIQIGLLQEPFTYRVSMAGFERGDMKGRYSSYAVGRQWGWLSVNDVRDFEDLNRIGSEGDIYLTPLNMAAATDQGDPAGALDETTNQEMR